MMVLIDGLLITVHKYLDLRPLVEGKFIQRGRFIRCHKLVAQILNKLLTKTCIKTETYQVDTKKNKYLARSLHTINKERQLYSIKKMTSSQKSCMVIGDKKYPATCLHIIDIEPKEAKDEA